MAAMQQLLRHLEKPEVLALYQNLDQLWDDRTRRLNERLRAEALPVRIANMSSIWTVCYTRPSRYNWMLQYYLREQGLALSWVGTGRLIFSLDYTQADFAEVADRFVAGAEAMQHDGWWWHSPGMTNRSIRRRVLNEMIRHWLTGARGDRYR
jgi:glutamate-1-semialdehyde 2,1-aminomutase